MQSVQPASSSTQTYTQIRQQKEAIQITFSQISLLLTTLTEDNFSSIESKINFLLEKSPLQVYIKYWKFLLVSCAPHITQNGGLLPEQYPLHRLLLNLFRSLPYKSQEFLQPLREETFDNLAFQEQTGLTLQDITQLFLKKESDSDRGILEILQPDLLFNRLKSIKFLIMNNFKYLQTLLSEGSPATLEGKLNEVFMSLNGEPLNDTIALLLSEILSPGSQHLLQDGQANGSGWLTPEGIPETRQIGEAISNALARPPPNAINWNRVFNLMSTKYFMNTQPKPSIASLNCLFISLKHGYLIDQFFGCDWSIDFKLFLVCQLHKWPVSSGCYDLLSLPDTKKVSDTLQNSKNSLLYLLSVSTLDLELFLLRDELGNNPMLSYYQECFFEDFNAVPEYLYMALVQNMKHFTLLIDNKNIIDEIIVTLLVQVFDRYPSVANDLLAILPRRDKLLVDVGKMVIKRRDNFTTEFMKHLAKQEKLEMFFSRVPFVDVFPVLPAAIQIGWQGFNEFVKTNMNSDNVTSILDTLELQTRTATDNNSQQPQTQSQSQQQTPFKFGLSSLHFLITTLMDFPLTDSEEVRFGALQYSIILSFPRIINFNNGHDEAILANGDFTPFNSDVEKEMQSYLQRMYSGDMAIKDVVDILRRLKESDNPRDQDVFACITHAVLGECSFFEDYPLEALAATSVLFGSMILFHLLNGFVLDVALRTILNFAREGPESKLFKFAIQAIYAFRTRLSDFPQYCKDLLDQIPALQTQTQVYQLILSASKASADPGRLDQSRADDKPAVELLRLKYFNVGDWTPSTPQENPPREATEKVLFIVNNITMDNFDSKIGDLARLLLPKYYSWFSNYLVNQRAKTEPNYQKLYRRLILSINSRFLHECVLNTTLRQLYFFLGAKDKNSVDKKLLKNLATWLGTITIGIDKPIRYTNVAFREMLLEAMKEDRLDIVVPFVSKVLQSAAESKVFRPPNPWTVGILQLLLEINQKANWKLSLTFEVEVLFKTLKLSMQDIEPSNFIGQPDILETLSGSLGGISIEQQRKEHEAQMMLMQQYQQHMLLYRQRQQHMLNEQAQFSGVDALNASNNQQSSTNILGSVGTSNNNVIQSNQTSLPTNDTPFSELLGSTLFVTHPELKRLFQMALAKSVREILVPAVEKSSNIAAIATMKLVSKDFATEADEMKLKAAAGNMVRHLAQSLARATSIEPLREGIRSTIQSLAPNLMPLSPNPLVELDTAINDNIILALSLIENAAMERATQEINEQLVQAVAIRRYHRERAPDQPFLAPNANPYSLNLPEPLGLKSVGVTAQQFGIYEEFGKFPPAADTATNINVISKPQSINQQIPIVSAQAQQDHQAAQVRQQSSMQPNVNQGMQTAQNAQVASNTIQSELEQNHRVLIHLMDILVVQIKENAKKQSLTELGENNQIKTIIFQILTFIARSPQKDQLALKVSQAVVNSLFATSDSPLCREVLSLLLEKLCSLSLVARKDVSWWLIYALDSRKFDVRVIRSLLEVKLIDANELDTVLVTAMEKRMGNATEFAVDLIKDTVLSDNPLLMRMDFIHTLNYLSTLDDEKIKKFLSDYNLSKVLPVSKDAAITRKEKYYLVFTEWAKLLQRVEPDDKITLIFISQILDKGVVTDTDSLIEFMKSSLELSIYSFKESDPTGEVFITIDALGKMMIKLLLLQDFSEYSRSEYLNMILSVILLVFSKDHQDASFNERPYFRLLSNLLFEWGNIRIHNFASIKNPEDRKELRSFDVEFYNIFANYLHAFQPFAFAGFSFAWISLISHRMFLPIILRLPGKSGWEKLMILIIDLLRFLDRYTKKNSLSDAISVVYKGTLRVILGISNDVPSFLISNHYELMNHMPAAYFQLKNVVLSALPLKMIAPNPYTRDLDLSTLDACKVPPPCFYDPVNDLHTLKKPVDNYLRIPSNSLFKTIIGAVYRTEYDYKNGVGFDLLTVNTKLVRAIVMHVAVEVGLENERTSSSAVFNTKSSYYTLLFSLIQEGTIELKYHVLQVMMEQLRYPNIHTYWFIYVLLNMFTSEEFGDQLAEVQEIVLRCLLERVMANKPHPWGITVLFVQLLSSTEIDLLDLDFVKRVPEIHLIFRQLKKYTSPKLLEKQGGEKVDGEANNQPVLAATS